MTSTNNNPAQVQQNRGVISTLLSFIFHLIAILIISLFISLVIEWIGIAFIWPEQGAQHSYQMMVLEKSYLSDDFADSLFSDNTAIETNKLLSRCYQWLFVDTGLERWIVNAKQNPNAHWSYKIYYTLSSYIEAAIYITIVFLIRVIILVLTTPLFLLTAIVGVVDGLVRRDLRRFGCGYESGFIYHHAKRTIRPLFIFAWFIYLSLPFSLHPNWVLIPAAMLFGLAISVMSGAFKKYL